MTTLEIVLIVIIWVAYGVFNSWQHDWFKDEAWNTTLNIIYAPIALIVRILRGVFFWKGGYKNRS